MDLEELRDSGIAPVLHVIADEVYGKPMSLEPVTASDGVNTFR